MSRIFPAPIIGQSAASGAQVVDGSLRFDGSSNYLKRTPSSSGNRRTYTFSCWLKRQKLVNCGSSGQEIFRAGDSALSAMNFAPSDGPCDALSFKADQGGVSPGSATNAVFRDFSAFFHVVYRIDTTHQTTAAAGVRVYVNGVEQTWHTTNYPTQNQELKFNQSGQTHYIGGTEYFAGHMSQVYLIDGAALGPEYFGFTDPLTNTWRPKKFRAEGTTVNDGTTWSSGIPGNTLSGYPATNAFNGNVSSFVYANVNTTMTWTAPKRITGQKIEVYAYAGGTHPILNVNGQSTGAVVGGTTQHNVWVDVTDLCGGPGGVLETITAYGQNIGGVDRQSGFSAVAVDGVILIDNTTQNLDFGTNGFYLPFDGNSPIGQDKSGKGNDFTPINFGGSNSLEKATGALPILNTTQGGTQATVGYFGSRENKNITVTVAGKTGGGNAYFFDGVERDSLALLRGTTITFDTTDSSNNSHPFKLSSTNADSSGGTEYTDGVAYFINGGQKNGSDYVSQYANNGGGTGFRGIRWTVPHNVSTTYYYCTVHNGMGEGGRLTSTTDASKADPFAWKCVLALPLVGTTNDISNQINLGTSGKSITTSGAVASSGFNNFYNGSFFFDGSDDFLSIADNTDFTVGSAPFTFEFWRL